MLDGEVIFYPQLNKHQVDQAQIDKLTVDNTKLTRQVTEQNQVIRIQELKIMSLEKTVDDLTREKNQLQEQIEHSQKMCEEYKKKFESRGATINQINNTIKKMKQKAHKKEKKPKTPTLTLPNMQNSDLAQYNSKSIHSPTASDLDTHSKRLKQ